MTVRQEPGFWNLPEFKSCPCRFPSAGLGAGDPLLWGFALLPVIWVSFHCLSAQSGEAGANPPHRVPGAPWERAKGWGWLPCDSLAFTLTSRRWAPAPTTTYSAFHLVCPEWPFPRGDGAAEKVGPVPGWGTFPRPEFVVVPEPLTPRVNTSPTFDFQNVPTPRGLEIHIFKNHPSPLGSLKN